MNTSGPKGKLGLTLIDGSDFQVVQIECRGLIEPEELPSHSLLEQFNSSKPVIFDGRAPTWLYAHLAALAIDAPWVACADARGFAVVAASRLPQCPIGTRIPRDTYAHLLRSASDHAASVQPGGTSPSKVIAIVGPPNNGKSVLAYRIFATLQRSLDPIPFSRNVFLYRAAPDGEGNWSYDVPAEQFRLLRHKDAFTEEFARKAAEAIRGIREHKGIVLVDCGGRIDVFQRTILAECSHALLVGVDRQQMLQWQGALLLSGLQIVAVIESTMDTASEMISPEPLRLRLGPLKRGLQLSAPPVPDSLVEAILGGTTIRI